MLALTAYAEEQAKGYERIPLPEGWTVGSITLFQDDGGARGYESQAWNFWGEVSGRGPTRAEAVLNAVRRAEKLMAMGRADRQIPARRVAGGGLRDNLYGGHQPREPLHYQTCDPATGQLVTHSAERLRDIPDERNYREV
jgi:hypothetical protein